MIKPVGMLPRLRLAALMRCGVYFPFACPWLVVDGDIGRALGAAARLLGISLTEVKRAASADDRP